MALLFCDSFDAYTVIGDLPLKWSGSSSVSAWNLQTSGGKFGGNYVKSNTSGSYQAVSTPNLGLTATSSFNFGFYFKQSVAPTGTDGYDYPLIGMPLSAGYYPGLLAIGTGSNLIAYGYNSIGNVPGSKNVVDGQWHWIEALIVLSTSAGVGKFQVWVDGVLDINFSGQTLTAGATAIGTLAFGQGCSDSSNLRGVDTSIDDIIIYDTTGSFMNAAPLGPRRIACINPNAAGASTQFTPSSGSNWSNAAQAYSGTAYNATASTGQTDEYATGGMPYTPQAVVNAVVVNNYALNPAGDGTKSIAAKLRSGATPTTVTGTSRTLGATAINYQDMFYQDGNSTNWTYSSVNAAQPGVGT